MSTLQTNKIQHLTSGFNNIVTHTDGAGTVNAAHARAWVNFNGQNTVAINAQLNVSSITDHGTGEYSVNYTNALSDANYVFAGSCIGATSAETLYTYSFLAGASSNTNSVHSTSATRFTTPHTSNGLYDHEMVQIVVFR